MAGSSNRSNTSKKASAAHSERVFLRIARGMLPKIDHLPFITMAICIFGVSALPRPLWWLSFVITILGFARLKIR